MAIKKARFRREILGAFPKRVHLIGTLGIGPSRLEGNSVLRSPDRLMHRTLSIAAPVRYFSGGKNEGRMDAMESPLLLPLAPFHDISVSSRVRGRTTNERRPSRNDGMTGARHPVHGTRTHTRPRKSAVDPNEINGRTSLF